jgi:hypothetical protein
LQLGDWQELTGDSGAPYQQLTTVEDGSDAGYVRAWRGPDNLPLDRMIHMRLITGPVETQLLFVFGRSDTTMPHMHAQVVQFPPAGCVYNMDLLPRLDPVENPDWFTRVMGPLRRAYRKATSDKDNSCAQAPANPALALFMSPYGIASAATDLAELEKVAPCIDEYLEHYCTLANETGWEAADPKALRERDKQHLQLFFADELDPRAWNGVYRIIGEAAGLAVKAAFQTPLK